MQSVSAFHRDSRRFWLMFGVLCIVLLLIVGCTPQSPVALSPTTVATPVASPSAGLASTATVAPPTVPPATSSPTMALAATAQPNVTPAVEPGDCLAEKCLSFTVTITPVAQTDPVFKGAPRLQAFVTARSGTRWLLVGGRIQGFHGFSEPNESFPVSGANKMLWVVDTNPTAATHVYSRSLDTIKSSLEPIYYQLLSANMEGFQNGNQLYVAGGYGTNAKGDYETHPLLTVFTVDKVIEGIINNTDISNDIAYVEDARMAVTGGELSMLDNGAMYLVMGQVFTGKYSVQAPTDFTQLYTDEIRKFHVAVDGKKITIDQYEAFIDPHAKSPHATTAPNPINDDSQYHRRDLNVEHTVLPDGSLGIGIYAGVFTPRTQLPYTHTIYISKENTTNNPPLPDTFGQRMSAYACANLLMYDPTQKVMYTTFFGGISHYYFDYNTLRITEDITKGLPTAPDPYFDDGVPWTNSVTTIARTSGSNSSTREMVFASTPLPGFFGGEANIILDPSMTTLTFGDVGTDIVDYSKLSVGKVTRVGYMYGGIQAFPYPGQNSGTVDTDVSDMIFEINITVRGTS